MPRKKVKENIEINYENNQELVNKLITGAEDKKYIIINYTWLFDYYKILNMVSKEFTFRYNPSLETKHFIEISAFNDVIVVAKIPIIHTNIKEEILVKIKYIVPFSKYQDNLFVFIFDDNTISYRYSYNTRIKILNTNNDKYFSLYSFSKRSNDEFEENDLASEEEDDDEYTVQYESDTEVEEKKEIENNGQLDFSFLAEEEISITQESCYRNIENTLIKNVICYLTIDFDHLKDIFNKFGNTRLQIGVKGNIMTMKAVSPNYNKKSTVILSVLNINKNYYNKEISFFINTKSIIKFKSLSSNFSISPNEDKKIFKTVEFKIICQETEDKNIYGITLFPGNFKSLKDSKIDNFDLYNSLMIFIPQNE